MPRSPKGTRANTAAGSSPPRVLVVLGNFALNGQERGNIEVFYAAKDVGVEALFVTHRAWGGHHIQPALDERDLAWTTLDYARHFTKRLSFGGWVRNVGRLLKASWELRRIARKYRPTHIHVANPHYFLSVLPALLLMRTPVVFRLGDVPTQHHILYRLLWRWFVIPRVEQFVCISEYVQKRLLESGAPLHKTQVIYSYPPERLRLSSSSAALEGFEGRTVVYVGQIAPHKGVHHLIQVATTLCQARNDVRFVLVGAISRQNAFALDLAGRVQVAGLQGRIRFLGYRDDVPGLLQGTDVHVCPSVCEEALGNVVLEAKQAGVPSVVFPSGGLPELIEHGANGWVCDAASVEELRKGILHFLQMDEEELAEAKATARDSLNRMGITKRAFAHAWLEVFKTVSVDPQRRRANASVRPSEVVST